jgi:hypothetical protein
MRPEVTPDREYQPSEGTVAWRPGADGNIVLEVFARGGTSYGFRYQAWVAWRDAGGYVRSHGWHRVESDEALFTDEYDTACTVAERHAWSKGIELGPVWRSVV